VCALEANVALKPANLSFESAAAVPIAAITALQGLRDKGRIKPAKGFLLKARLVEWAHLRSRLPNGSGLKSLPYAAPGIWTKRDRSVPTMSWITPEKISRRAGSVTISSWLPKPIIRFSITGVR
jgi:hypothetical protein